jgi:DNA-directed RNA polymerase specialized sigma24 family protein
MNSCPPEPDDDLLVQWTSGSPEERENVLKVAWQRYHDQLKATLKGGFSGLVWQDCEDIADDAYCNLWRKLSQGKFVWNGSNSLLNFLCDVARNDAIDLIRKRKRRAGLEVEIQAREEERAPEAPDAWMERMEWEMLRKSRYAQATERLLACVEKMKRAQRSVGVVMADCWVSNSRWPTNARILEVLRETEPELKLGTVIERRKEVVAKFRPVLDVLCQID